jgi:hypothetical protein
MIWSILKAINRRPRIRFQLSEVYFFRKLEPSRTEKKIMNHKSILWIGLPLGNGMANGIGSILQKAEIGDNGSNIKKTNVVFLRKR